MGTAINAGSYSVSGSYSDTKTNSTANGFINNYGQASPEVWYSFTIGGGTNSVNVSLCESNFDTYLHVLNSSGTEIASNDDGGPLCTSSRSSLSFTNLAPGTYYAVAEGYSTNTGAIIFALDVTIITPLTISYAGPQTYSTGTAITALSPTVSGTVPAPGQTSTFAGTGSAGSANGTGTSASFNQPLGATVDASGNIYVAEGGSHLIRKITPASVVTTFAGSGTQGFANGTGTGASFYHPVGLAADASGNIYVADEDNNMIRKITPAGVVTTLAGSGAQGSTDGAAASATFYYPCGVAVDGSGNVYVADAFNNKIRKISGGVVSTLAGSGTASSVDGTGTGATFNQPFSVVTDASGNVYVTDRVGAKIRKVTPAGVVTTLAGSGTASYADGTGTVASFNAPTGLGIDKAGNLYVTDEANNRIRKVTSAGVVTTLSGTGAQGSMNGAGNASTFYLPFAIAANAGGLVYVGDFTTNLIRKIVATPFTINPALPAGLTLNNATGVISGTPTAAMAQKTYTITANNSTSTATAPLVMTVTQAGALSLSFDRNYIVTYVPRIKDLTTDAQIIDSSWDKDKEQIDVQYFDGLGRPQQSVQVKGSATGRDIVQPIVYDAYNREALKYQPYVVKATNGDGSYKTTAVADQAAFYADPTNVSTWNSPGVKATSAPYAQTVFEQSPMNRITEQGAPGTDWQPSGTTGHTKKVVYTTNNTTAISDTSNTYYAALYTVGTDGSLLLGINGQNNYAAGKLHVTVSKDENWKNTGLGNSRGGTIEEYKDDEEHVVLKRVFNFVSGTPAKLEVLSTYYVYDDFGNLCYVLPPGSGADGGITSALNQAMLDGVCYQYKYDGRNRLVEKRVPGKGWEYMVYNKLDQVVATQDANQRNMTPLQQASFTKYDAIGRVALTGIYNVPNATVAGQNYRANMQSDANNQATLWESRQYVGTSGTTDYTSAAYPQADFTPLLINYYDNYTAIPGRPGYYLPAVYSTQTTGLLTASRTAVLNSPTVQLLTVHSYDDKGREIGNFGQHYKGSSYTIRNYDGVTKTYDFTNAVTTATRKHYIYDSAQTAPQLKVTIWNRYLYDHMGRKVKTWQQITNADGVNDLTPDTKALLSKLVYNELGQLWQKNLHTTDTTGTGNAQQLVTYGYNERGWLLSSSAPLFAEQLYYNTGTNKYYNGNIAYQFWGIPGNLDKHYSYSYDQLNRLQQGYSSTGDHENGITYDLMGNIKFLQRYATTSTTLIDRLTYNYPANSNQLSSVTDDSGNALGQKNGTATYGYDLNGNLTSDDSRGILSTNPIKYNLLNLPQSIAALNTTYTYDANGQKLRKVITGTGALTTEYIGGIQYNGAAIDFIQTEEGRAIPKDAIGYNYEYSLTDHLGNSRVNFDTSTGTTARQVQTDDYYPFGMESNSTVLGTKSLYLYNKKELQQNGLNMYDYGARFYDPVIGRFCSIDPLAEKDRKWSTYSYGHNNPISHVDVDGMFDMVRLNDGTTLNDKSVNSQAEVSKKYGAGAKDVSGQTWTTGRDGVSVHFTKDSWEYVNAIKDIPYEGTTMALQDGIRANLPMLNVASTVATGTAFATTGGLSSIGSSGFSLLGGQGYGIRAVNSFLSQASGSADFVQGVKNVDFSDVVADTFLGTGSAAFVNGAIDFKPFDNTPFRAVGFNKSFSQAAFESASYFINGQIMDHVGATNTSGGYSGVTQALQIGMGGSVNMVINGVENRASKGLN